MLRRSRCVHIFLYKPLVSVTRSFSSLAPLKPYIKLCYYILEACLTYPGERGNLSSFSDITLKQKQQHERCCQRFAICCFCTVHSVFGNDFTKIFISQNVSHLADWCTGIGFESYKKKLPFFVVPRRQCVSCGCAAKHPWKVYCPVA